MRFNRRLKREHGSRHTSSDGGGRLTRHSPKHIGLPWELKHVRLLIGCRSLPQYNADVVYVPEHDESSQRRVRIKVTQRSDWGDRLMSLT